MQGKSVGEVEAAVAAVVCRTAKEMHGCGARAVRCQLVDSMLVVILDGVLSIPQQRLFHGLTGCGSDYKACLRGYRAEVWKMCRDTLQSAIVDVTGQTVVSMFHDFCPESGDEMLVFRLEGIPVTRQARG